MTIRESRLRALRRQTERIQRRLAVLDAWSDRYSWTRVAVVSAGMLFTIGAFYRFGAWPFWICLVATIALFVIIVQQHRRVDAAIHRYTLLREIKDAQVARMQVDWAKLPAPTFAHPREDYPLELDLDLTGERSLHRLIDQSVSLAGSRRLREWLASPSTDIGEIRRRQKLVRDLIPNRAFRERLILNGRGASEETRPEDDGLLLWLQTVAPASDLRRPLYVLGLLAPVNILLFALYALQLIPALWAITFTLYAFYFLIVSRDLGDLFHDASGLQAALERLTAVFRHLEEFSYRGTPALRSLCSPFLDSEQRPSAYLRRLARVVNATGIRGNPFVWFALNALVPWDIYFGYRLRQHADDLAEQAPHWLNVWHELEALSSLANLACINSNYTLPEISDETAEYPIALRARQLGHPLIPHGEKVCNDFTIDENGEVVIITGSNMAGKSTFLKTIAINLVLAFAGGPVDAQHFHTALCRVFTCIRISDSVTDGISYFYAEVQCLKALLEELQRVHALPLVFFIDEIFRGTNNRERLIGSRAYIRALAGSHGAGLIATHDLELVQLANEMPAVRNYHFREDVVDGRMVFDYRLRPGPCPTTNALRIMQMEGLPVPAVDETGNIDQK